jgi:hypothetical protein
MRKASCFVAVMLLLLVWSIAQAEEIDVTTLPGYVNLEDIKIPAGASKMAEISLGPGLIKIAQKSSDNGDKKLTQTLSNLYCIQVKTFELEDEDAEGVIRAMKQIAAKLNKDEWERLVTVKDDDEFVIVSVKQKGDRVQGLLVMVAEPGDEAVFANIVGDFKLEDLGDLDDILELETDELILEETEEED